MKRRRREIIPEQESEQPIQYIRPRQIKQLNYKDDALYTVHDVAQEYVRFTRDYQNQSPEVRLGEHLSQVTNEGKLIQTQSEELFQKMRVPISTLEAFIQYIKTSKLPLKVSKALIVSSQSELFNIENCIMYLWLSQKSQIRKMPVNIAGIIQQELSHLMVHFREYKLSLQSTFTDIPEIPCSAELFSLCIRNILINILEAAPEKSEITIKIWIKTENTHTYIVAEFINKVSFDTAQFSDLNKVFDLFYTTKESHLGIGLTVCRAIMRGLNGEITINNPESETIVVTLKLPAG